jgi:hypothetical protein
VSECESVRVLPVGLKTNHLSFKITFLPYFFYYFTLHVRLSIIKKKPFES